MRGSSIRINRKSWKKMIKKRSKHRSETYQISIQNRPKNNQTSIENNSKIHPKSMKNLSKSRLERTKVAHFVLGGVLEASWARLRGQHSPKLASQIEGKSIRNPCKNTFKNDAFQVSVWMQFWWIFGRKMEACWHQNRIKSRCQLLKADLAKSIENTAGF